MTGRRWAVAAMTVAAAASSLVYVPDARAFCGFYVSGADAPLTNSATQVVLMREGTRTVLSMQNNYQGPPQDFAMVVPVPIVLRKENVKTLPREVFDRVDRLTAPRLVEYWEQDPCPKPSPMRAYPASAPLALDGMADMRGRGAGAPPPVKIEAQFTVGEYDIVVLSATDSTALDTWLRQNGYKIPPGAEPYLRPYVQLGMKFFVAKVDVAKVKFERTGNGPEQAALSPLRFHYDSDTFSLPIRLGLINSSGTQDLVVTVLSPGQRYEVANYDNVAVPTNVDVSDATRNQFASFYATLFDETVQRHPRSVVTEYSWAANSCDPCPTPPLEQSDLMTLGADVLPSTAPAPVPGSGAPILRPMRRPPSGNFVITRLHARYSKDALGDDLVFRAAAPIVGGREFMQNDGKLEQGARPDSSNNFQARYVIRHPWAGPMACKNPTRGVWGGQPGRDPWSSGSPEVKAASKIGLLPRAGALSLASFVRGAMPPESLLSNGGPTPFLGVPMTAATTPSVPDTGVPEADASTAATPYDASSSLPLPSSAPVQGGCAGCAAAPSNAPPAAALAGLAALLVARLRRRRK
jgi:uncharacterized protein (TIGR03382 family)